jgi:hypothetical protein
MSASEGRITDETGGHITVRWLQEGEEAPAPFA